MEKAKISAYQLFVLVLLFELGSALILPLAIGAKQDAWLAILLGMIGGGGIFLMYDRLFRFYPDILLTEYVQKIIGKTLGRILAFFYLLYFAYIAARVMRDFGVMLVTFAYPDTPLFIINALLTIVVVYTVHKGVEVLARSGELLFVLIFIVAIVGFILVLASGLIDPGNLKPVLEERISSVLKVTLTETLYFPFGETVVFAMLLPYLNHPFKARKIGLLAIGLSGVILASVMAINISVLGVSLTSRSQFPLLTTIQMIQVAEFLERLDIFFMLTLVVAGFFKISILLYAVVTGTANLFQIENPSRLAYPIGLVILILSVTIASNFAEHLQEGLQLVPVFLHIPFQIVIPLFLLILAFFKTKRKQGQ